MPPKLPVPFLKHILILMDPLEKLDLRWDNSLALAHEFSKRGTSVWTADSSAVRLEEGRVLAHAAPLMVLGARAFRTGRQAEKESSFFDLIIIRKEPPFDLNYLYLTYMLEKAAAETPIVNHPRGIRNANEKLWGLLHTDRMPETIISASTAELMRFYRSLKSAMVVKRLDEKGGRGIFLIPRSSKKAGRLLHQATSGGAQTIACQRFVRISRGVDKRIVLLDGRILCAFEKHPSPGDFRANLGLGATAHATSLTRAEKSLAHELALALKREGLYLAGLDVMGGKLLEVNVTSPAGMTDAESLYPGAGFIRAWADWLSRFSL